jgi:type IV pilus assembly protein PilN
MIRINLLATGPRSRKAKPQWDVRAEALIGIGVLLVTLTGCWYYAASLDEDIQAKQSEKQVKDKQVAQLKEQVKAVQDFEEKKKQLEAKNRIIDQLEKEPDRPGESAGPCQSKPESPEGLAGAPESERQQRRARRARVDQR